MHSVIDCKAPLYKKISYFLPKILGKCMKLLILLSEKEKKYIDMIVNGNFLLARAHSQ